MELRTRCLFGLREGLKPRINEAGNELYYPISRLYYESFMQWLVMGGKMANVVFGNLHPVNV